MFAHLRFLWHVKNLLFHCFLSCRFSGYFPNQIGSSFSDELALESVFLKLLKDHRAKIHRLDDALCDEGGQVVIFRRRGAGGGQKIDRGNAARIP
jgi:hypothetical protein